MRILGLLGLLPLLLASVACSTLQTPAQSGAIQRVEGPGAVFFSIEDAAMDALAYAHSGRFPGGRASMLAGTIRQIGGGFTYTEPTRASYRRPGRQAVRFELGSDDVASYVVYKRQRNARVDHLNERISHEAMRMVREVDDQQRPLYVLTPSLNVVQYDATSATTLARLDQPRPRTMAVSMESSSSAR